MYFIGGMYTLKINVTKTRAFYVECRPGLCPCAACRNFVGAAGELSPEVWALFAQFGVDLLKPKHLYLVERSSWGKRCAYEAEYPVVGRILRNGESDAVPDTQTKYLAYADASISFDHPVGQGLSLLPSFVMRATLMLPWTAKEVGGAAL